MKLSVIIPAYNLEKYISECLFGVLEQVTSFSFEVICIDDCSSDGTWGLLEKHSKEYTNLKVIKNSSNLGLAKTQKELLQLVTGEYIAYLDGDDVALPGKLQGLVDYMDDNTSCALAYHEAEVFDSDTGDTLGLYSKGFYNAKYVPQRATVEHFIKFGCFANASSIIFRRHGSLLNAIEESCKIILDYPWHILNVLYIGGSVDFIDKVYGRYRIHNQSFGGRTRRNPERRVQSMNDQILAVKNARKFGVAQEVIDKGIAHHQFAAALYFLKLHDFVCFQQYVGPVGQQAIFFDERHIFAFANREYPELVLQKLFPELVCDSNV